MNMETLLYNIYTRKAVRVLLHIVFWILLTAVQWHLANISFSPYKFFPSDVVVLHLFTSTLNTAIFYYTFVYFVLPQMLYKKRWIAAMIATLTLGILYALLDATREKYVLVSCSPCMQALKDSNIGYYEFLHASLPNRLLGKVLSMGTFIGLLFSVALPLSIKLGMHTLRQQFRSMKLEKDNLQLEFNFLRSQVNPHFLFNTLNNIYGLILNDQKEKSADLVARLSQFLRYTLYESDSGKIAIEKEVQLLKDYIDLESIRLNYTRVNFTHQTDGSVNNIAPLLMIPVVENAFKYCADHKEAYIDIDFRVANKQLYFSTKNSIDPDRQSAAIGGIGLANFCKRLQLYYSGMHQYLASATEKEYAVSVNINCYE